MNSMIEIKRGGETVGRVVFGAGTDSFEEVLGHCGHIYLVYDRAVERYANALSSSCRIESAYALDNVGEDIKTLDTVRDICRWLMENGADRGATVLAVGGGIVSDMAGFAASIYKRGIRSVYLPTTLLAQVDAAIGGKTGVNLDSYKNMIGTFCQPEYTLICPEVLASLPVNVFADGLAEMLKTFIIDNGPDSDRVGRMLDAVEDIKMRDRENQPVGVIPDAFARLIEEAASVKAGIVSRDEHEKGERRLLNLGHTFAHAIEYCANSAGSHAQSGVSHGEAVAIGLSMAARLSEAIGLAKPGLADMIDRSLGICGLPCRCPFPLGMLEDAMKKDKKSDEGKVHFILIEDIGAVTDRLMDVHEALEALGNNAMPLK